jgi:hypothetical protein
MPTRASAPIVLLVAAACLFGGGYAVQRAATSSLGAPLVYVHVRWATDVDAARRQSLERELGLTYVQLKEGTTYGYFLADPTRERVSAVVRHPAVADTHNLDRSTFEPTDDAEWQRPDPAAEGAVAAAALLRRSALVALVLALAAGFAPALTAGALASARQLTAHLVARMVPVLTAEAAALFRVVFGALVVLIFTVSGTGRAAVPETVPANTGALMRSIGGAIVAAPELANWITPIIVLSGGLFIAGALTRLSFATLTAAVFAWGVVHSLRYGHHPVSALLVAMICLLPARMADAWSVDAAWRRRPAAPSREYGYAVWVPGVVFGLALAAAAAAKLRTGGLDWVLNGTVKYHFLSDAAAAPVDWGVRFALVPAVAVAMSFAAVAVEVLTLPAALVRWYPARALAGLCGAAMLSGFYLFQGLFWPGWWVLLLSFAPWHLADDRLKPQAASPGPGASHREPAFRITALGCAQAMFILAAGIQQMVVSARKIELAPVLSAYDMYSETYSSADEYERQMDAGPVLVASMPDGSTAECHIGDSDVEAVAASGVDHTAGEAATVIAECFPRLPGGTTLTLESTHPRVDWAAGRLLGENRVLVAGPFIVGR